jgi:hypothetical protein
MALPTATAYLSEADADAHFAASFNAAAWAALTSAEKTTALAEATRWLEALCWSGEKCSDTQPLQWPRKADAAGCCGAMVCTTLPAALVQATAELALAMHKDKTAVIGGGTSSGAIKSASLGGLSVTYKDDVVTTTKVSGSAPLVLQKFPWLVDLLSPCLMQNSSGSARVLHRSCA